MSSTVNGRVHTHHWLRLPGREGVTVSAVTHARVLPGACGRGGVTGLRGCGQYIVVREAAMNRRVFFLGGD